MVFQYTGVGCSVPKDVISVRCKEGLQKIEVGAFLNCQSLKSIILPSTVTEIGDNAFEGCTNLNEVIFNDGVQKIGNWAFCNCPSLENIKLPSTVTEIGAGAFNHCTNLSGVVLNHGLQKIGDAAFYNCSLESIKLPSTVTEIGDSAFNSCSNLRKVTFNNGLQKIGKWAFRNCTPLQSITIPSSLVEIGNRAFCDCSNLREVELNGVPQVKSEAFSDCDALNRFLFTTISCRLVNIIQTSHWEDLEDKLNEIRGVVQWESDKLLVSRPTRVELLLGARDHNWDIIRRDFDRITRLVWYYELKEATSTFELALWKFNLDQVDTTSTTNRAAYRIDVPGPVKDKMLQYLDHICSRL